MKRRLLIHLPVFFLIGVVLSYAVAWGWILTISLLGLDLELVYFDYGLRAIAEDLESVDGSNNEVLATVGGYSGFGVEVSRGPGLHAPPSKMPVLPLGMNNRIFLISTGSRSTYFVYEDIGYSDANWSTEIDSDALPTTAQMILRESAQEDEMLIALGWPFLSACGWHNGNPNSPQKPRQYIHVLRLWPDTESELILPYRPIYRNLVFNSLFYGLLAYGLWLAPGPFIRRRRMRKGFCPRCKYNLRGDYFTGCPECGWGRQSETVEVSETE